jgi:hypothetical protein
MIGSRRYPLPDRLRSEHRLVSDLAEDRARLRNQVQLQLGTRRLIAERSNTGAARNVATSRQLIERSRELLSRGVARKY